MRIRKSRPGNTTGTALQLAKATPKHNGYRRVDGYAAPDAEGRADAEVIAAAYARGYRLAVQCMRCGQWLVAHRSVRDHLGPVCRSKAAADA